MKLIQNLLYGGLQTYFRYFIFTNILTPALERIFAVEMVVVVASSCAMSGWFFSLSRAAKGAAGLAEETDDFRAGSRDDKELVITCTGTIDWLSSYSITNVFI
jgi:hypothetical protein